MSSPYLLAMHGKLVIVGYQPDGDSIRFIAETPDLFDDLYRGYKIRRGTRDDSVQLRLEAIDAPELHYGNAAQPTGDTARDWLLGQLGFTDVTYETGTTSVVSASPDAVPAVIYTKASDPNGRPISYLHLTGGRRATDFLKDVASKGFAGNLPDWLVANNTGTRHEDDMVVLPHGVEVPLSTLLEQRNNWLAFTPDLLEIAFVEK